MGMPCDYKKYPANWKTEIRPSVLKRANNCCEICGVNNYAVGYWDLEGKFWKVGECLDKLENTGYDIFEEGNELGHIPLEKKPIKIVLTIAHLDPQHN